MNGTTPKAAIVMRQSTLIIRAAMATSVTRSPSPATTPISKAAPGVTKPHAGVMVARPPIAPEQKPSTEGLPRKKYSMAGQVMQPAAAESVVVTKAFTATPSAATALPALKPYQPTQSMPVPTAQSVMLCGCIAVFPKPRRGPRIKQSTSALQPELMCTTVPPAKSIARIFASPFQTPFIKPSTPQTMWASGK